MEADLIKILIIDDKQENLDMISGFFDTEKYYVRSLSKYEDVIRIVGEIEFDLILLDVRMPVDGFTVCNQIKMAGKNRQTPVIFMIEKTDLENIRKAFNIGGRDVIAKPFEIEELVSKVSIHSLLNIHFKRINELMDAKNKIYSIISHDLRTPFNTLIGFSDLLIENLRESGQFENAKYAEIIHKISVKNLELLDNLLVYARNLDSESEYTMSKLNVNKLLTETIQIVQPSAELKNISLSQTFGPSAEIMGVHDLLATMLRNILTNAIKYTPIDGKVEISTYVSNNFVDIKISDTGIGMDNEMVNTIFNEDKSSRKGTSGETGTGYGLMLSKEIADKHDGSISVSSIPDKGSIFTIKLPLHK